MNRTLMNILTFARRQSNGVALAVRKAVALGVSIAFAVSPVALGLFPEQAEAKAPPAAPQAQQRDDRKARVCAHRFCRQPPSTPSQMPMLFMALGARIVPERLRFPSVVQAFTPFIAGRVDAA